MSEAAPKIVVDPCPDARGHFTIRKADGSVCGDTNGQPVATAYTLRNATRLVDCANACHDMVDPASEISELREALAKEKSRRQAYETEIYGDCTD
jgi:hypothetical protein